MEIKLEIRKLRCATCHCSEDLVNYTFDIRDGVMTRYYICREDNRKRNAKQYNVRKRKRMAKKSVTL